MNFSNVRNYLLEENRNMEALVLIIKDWSTTWETNFQEFKEATGKIVRNVTGKISHEKYRKETNALIVSKG